MALFMDGVQLSQGYKATMRSLLLFTIQFPGVPGTHLIDLLWKIKGWVDFGAT